MVIMSALGAGMVSIFGSSNLGNVVSMFQPRANYLAESGFAYAVKEYLRDDSETNIIANHNRTFTLANGDSFKTYFHPYWFKCTIQSKRHDPGRRSGNHGQRRGQFSLEVPGYKHGGQSYISVSDSPYYSNYTSATYTASDHTVTFGGLSTRTVSSGIERLSGGSSRAGTISPEGSSSSSNKFYVSIGSNSTALADFPQKQGHHFIHSITEKVYYCL